MTSKAKLALATLLAFGSASAVLAESNNGTNHRGPVVRGRTSPTMFEQRNATTSHAVKPFTAEGKGLVRPREPRLLKRLVAESKPGDSFQHLISPHYAQQ